MDIADQLRAACVGHTHAKIRWPHRLLHNAAEEIDRLRAALVRVQNFPSHPGGCPDDLSGEADDPASWRHGWICAVEALQDRALPK